MALLAWIVRWSLRNRAIVVMATLLFIGLGVNAAVQLPIDAVPDVTNVQVQVITTAPALSPVEVEQYVSIPVERALAGMPRTENIRSISKYGLSVITVVFREGTDMYFARQLINERLREAEHAIPDQYGTPEMGPISSGLGEIFQFVVRNDDLNLMQLEELLDWQIAPVLRTVPGIVEVNSFGGEDKQYQVVLDPKRLQASGISVAEVVDAMRKANDNAGGGYIEHDREHFVIGTDGLVKNLDDLRKVVIGATAQGVPITLATVGDVQFGPRLRRGAASKDGQGEVVVGVAMMLIGENSRTVTEAVKRKLAELQPTLPRGTVIEPFYDRSALVDRTTATVARNLLEGAGLVILVLLIMLGDLRAGIIVAATIPLSLLFAVIVMNAAGLSGNLMSLGAIDFGLIVDGAVIIVENAVRRVNEVGRALSPEERLELVESATVEVRSASVFGEAIIAVVYIPLLALTGVEGKLFRPMATTVLLALAGAFLCSLTIVPVLTSFGVRPRAGSHEPRFLHSARRALQAALRGAIRHRWLTIGGALITFAAALLLFANSGAEFVPRLDEGDLLVEARRLPGVALTESVATGMRMEAAILAIPEVLHVVTKTGAPEVATDPMGIEQSDVFITLKPREQFRPGITKQDLADEVSARLARLVPEVNTAISQPIEQRTNELIAGVRSDVALIVYGRDLDVLRRLGDELAAAISDIPGVADLRVEQVAGLRYLRITPERGKLARYGLSVADINQLVETIAVGHATGVVLEGERRFGIVVKTGHDYDGELEPLASLPLKSVSGQMLSLGDVADLHFETGPAEVTRENQSRRLTIEFNVRGRDLLSVVEDAQREAASEVKLPEGYRIDWGGQFDHYRGARQRLMVVVPAALALIAFMLWLAFRSARIALLIFANVPFAIIGGVFALRARELPFSISAGVGFIALFGVAVLNGLVLVAFSRQLEAQGVHPTLAITRAAEVRLRPVLMTALVAALGFVPMALSTAPGSEVQRPLATVVIGGVFSAMLLTLLLLPVIYALWFGRGGPPPAAAVSVAPDQELDSR